MRSLSLPFLALMTAALFLSGHAPEQQLAARFKTTERSRPETKVTVTGATGVGVFKDIQVPFNAAAGVRGDGQTAETEFQDHTGFPLIGGIGLSIPSGPWAFETELEVMQIASSIGPAETQSSSYGRMQLDFGASRTFDIAKLQGKLGTELGARRSSFNNVSNGHHIVAFLLGARAGIESPNSWSTEAFAYYAPRSYFAYHSGRDFKGNRFEGSQTTMNEVGLLGSFHLRKGAWLNLGLARESAVVVIDDLTEYNSFGLNVTPGAEKGRRYDIATTILRFGFRKDF